MSRASRAVSEKIAPIEAGDIDLVSKAVYFARIPTCGSANMSTGKPCTRGAGHDENRPGHAASVHVHTDVHFLVLEVWR